MTLQPSSARLPQSSPPPPPSWSLSEVSAVVQQLRDADALLHRVYATESARPSAVPVLEAADALREGAESLLSLLRMLGRPVLVACPETPEAGPIS